MTRITTTLTGLAFATCFAAHAATGEEIKTLKINEETHAFQIAMNLETVRCSARGYGVEELKVSVPQLKGVSFFDHSNVGETQPCMTAGACHSDFEPGGFSPDDLLKDPAPFENIELTLRLVEEYRINHDTRSCTRSVKEFVESSVRGIPFHHMRQGSLGSYPYDLCVRLKVSTGAAE